MIPQQLDERCFVVQVIFYGDRFGNVEKPSQFL